MMMMSTLLLKCLMCVLCVLRTTRHFLALTPSKIGKNWFSKKFCGRLSHPRVKSVSRVQLPQIEAKTSAWPRMRDEEKQKFRTFPMGKMPSSHVMNRGKPPFPSRGRLFPRNFRQKLNWWSIIKIRQKKKKIRGVIAHQQPWNPKIYQTQVLFFKEVALVSKFSRSPPTSSAGYMFNIQ